MTAIALGRRSRALAHVLGDEGLRLFFPLSALHLALWPFLWVVVGGFALPLDEPLPPTLRHAHEMLVGGFGAALIGFVTTAVPEWSNVPRLRGRPLFVLAALWVAGRVAGLLPGEPLATMGAAADAAWLVALPLYVAVVLARRPRARLLGMVLWLFALAAAGGTAEVAIILDDVEVAGRALHLVALVFVGLLGLVLGRITVPITNLVLDPSESTSPYRPHPGRLNLAPGMAAVALAGTLADLSPAVTGFLLIGAGAAFLDRTGEVFVGREALRAALAAPALSSLLGGVGLLLMGMARLGAPFPETPALHLVMMGGLGLAVLTVFAVAGLMHTGHRLHLPRDVPVAVALLLAAAALRVLPDIGVMPAPPGPPHALAAVLWAAAFLLWLWRYWPMLSRLQATDEKTC